MSRKTDLICAVIPCYNHGDYLNDAVDSILSQTYKNIEIFVVDDGSDDENTCEILKNLNKPKTTVLHKENGGPASARNFGIERCKSEYILTLDSDDRFEPTFVEKALSVLKENPKTGMVTSYVKRLKRLQYGVFKEFNIELEGGGIDQFLMKNHASASLLYRRRCWVDAGGYDEEIPGFEDWEFFISVTKHGWTVHSIPEYLFLYRLLDGSVYDHDKEIRPEIVKYMVQKHIDVYQKHIVDSIYSKECEMKKLSETVRDLRNDYNNSLKMKTRNFILQPYRWSRGFYNRYFVSDNAH